MDFPFFSPPSSYQCSLDFNIKTGTRYETFCVEFIWFDLESAYEQPKTGYFSLIWKTGLTIVLFEGLVSGEEEVCYRYRTKIGIFTLVNKLHEEIQFCVCSFDGTRD